MPQAKPSPVLESRKVTFGDNSYVLTWRPAPVSDWNLNPKDNSPAWEQMWAIVQSTLNTDGGKTMSHQRIEQPEDYTRPWAIVRLLPKAQRYTVARFANRQDTQDHKRVLQRFIPVASFEVVFDVPVTSCPSNTDS